MKKFENFCKSLKNLEEMYRRHKEPFDAAIQMGLVGLFSLCFEMAWQAMKENLSYEGWDEASTGSPRQIIKTAYQAGLITDMDGWLNAMRARNLANHTYNPEESLTIIKGTQETYLGLFQALRDVLAKRIGEEKEND